jgi:WD40 repeat protein
VRIVIALLSCSVAVAAAADWKEAVVLKPDQGMVVSAAFSPDGSMLAVGSLLGVKVYDGKSGRIVFENKDQVHAWAVQFSPNGQTLAAVSELNRSTKIFELRSRKAVADFRHAGKVYSAAFSPDGKTLASVGTDRFVKLWSVATGKETKAVRCEIEERGHVAYSPDGKMLVVTGEKGKARIFDAMGEKELGTIELNYAWPAAAFSPNSKLLAVGSVASVRIYDTAEFKEIAELKGHASGVVSLAFSPDGKLLASGSADRSVRLWDMTLGKEAAILDKHDGLVYGVAFSRDGKYVASVGGADKTVRIWTAAK